MKKFYRYIIYRLYGWYGKSKPGKPAGKVIATLAFVHFMQLLIICMIFYKLFPRFAKLALPRDINNIYGILFLIIFLIINRLLFYNKERWESYINEFKDESPQAIRKGSILVLSYLIGSIILFFVLAAILAP